MATHAPRDAADLLEVVEASCATGEPLEIVGRGRCRDYGRLPRPPSAVDLSALSGVTVYEPGELVLTAQAATPLAEIKTLLSQHRQHLAFEPPDLGPVWTQPSGGGSIGGCLLLGLGGSRRPAAGAPRDHFLGLKGINGHSKTFAAGGRVVKNVTGFDLPKLFAGSLGTLGVLSEVTLKVLPEPEQVLTLAFAISSAEEAIQMLTRACRSPAQVTGGAYLPEPVVARSAVSALGAAHRSFALLRLEGFAPSVEWSAEYLIESLSSSTAEPPMRLEAEDSIALWNEIGSAGPFVDGTMSSVWRITVEPSRAASIVAALEARTGALCYIDWFGGIVWANLRDLSEETSVILRAVVNRLPPSPNASGGGLHTSAHATLIRATPELRQRVPPFEPLAPAVAALTRRVKHQFDPLGIFNPGRMYEGL